MRISGMRWLAAAAIAGYCGLAAPAYAENTKPAAEHIAVIDVQLILRDSLAMKAVRDQIEAQHKSFQAEVTAEENKLRKAGEDLRKQRAVLSSEAFAQKERELQQRVSEVNTRVQNRKRVIDQAFSGAFNKVQDTLIAVATDIAKESGYSMVLAKNQVVYIDQSMDVTASALERLNKKLPTLQVNVPKK